MAKINSHNEWDPLKEIVVGYGDARAGLIFPQQGPVSAELQEKAKKLAREAFPQWLVDEINGDLDGLCDVLRKSGAKVLRPKKPDDITFNIFATPYVSAAQEHHYNMRDLNLVVGNTVIESPSQEKHRYFEAMGLYDVWYDYFKNHGGFKWICGPKPALDGDYMINYYADGTAEYPDGQKYIKLADKEILFEAANTVRMGRDLLYLVSRSGNELGAQWLQSVLGGEYRVHTTDKIYRSSHIDSTALCLRPGLVLLNAHRVTPETCPKIFDSWEKIYFKDIVKTPDSILKFQKEVRLPIHQKLAELGIQSTVDSIASDWIGINVLSIDQDTVVVDERQVPLMETLKKYGLTPVPISFRHSYYMGGIHCSTLDTVRDSKLESYCD